MSEQPEVRDLRDINTQLKSILESQTSKAPFWANGIVQIGYDQSDYGHTYFILIEGDYSIHCMLPEKIKRALDFTLSNGMEIEVYGTARIWDRQAQLQIQVDQINLLHEPRSISVLERLKKEGLYPKSVKRLPSPMNRVAVITSKTSRALDDFYTYYKKGESVTVIDVPLEGYRAPQEIANAIHRVNVNAEADVIVLIRGGGERTSLDTFDNYLIAEAICRSSIPVVTGIGHQGDKTIADDVADLPLSTPTAVGLELAKANSPQSVVTPIASPAPKTLSWQTMILLAIGFMLALAVLIFAISQLNL